MPARLPERRRTGFGAALAGSGLSLSFFMLFNRLKIARIAQHLK
jgi:hypothetical protein